MSFETLPEPPAFGTSIPERPHAVSVHLPKWQDVVDVALAKPRVAGVLKGGYPRSVVHHKIVQVHQAVIKAFGGPDDLALVFPAEEHAQACKDYLSSSATNKNTLPKDGDVKVLALQIDAGKDLGRQKLHAILYPREQAATAQAFWRITGCGIPSRFAELLVDHLDTLALFTSSLEEAQAFPTYPTTERIIKERLASLLDRAPIAPRKHLVKPDDVYFYPAGMSAIFNLTKTLRAWPGNQTVVFGFPYELTVKVQQDFAKDTSFYGFGTTEELDKFEDFLIKSPQGQVQAVWCECSSNPLLRTVDLDRIRRLADKFGFLVIVDDTIGSAANVDVMDVADVVLTSLTKSFNGYADVIAGSIAINPCSTHYAPLKELISSTYTDYLFRDDAVQLEINSRNFLERAAIMNRNASYLVSILSPLASPKSPLKHVYHPSTCWSAANYTSRLRKTTEEFTPGHGFLFTLEFVSLKTATAFYDALQVCKGPSIGAPITLALPYVQVVFQKEKEWAASYGVNEAIVRISVGLEDQKALAIAVLDAMRAADAALKMDTPAPVKGAWLSNKIELPAAGLATVA